MSGGLRPVGEVEPHLRGGARLLVFEVHVRRGRVALCWDVEGDPVVACEGLEKRGPLGLRSGVLFHPRGVPATEVAGAVSVHVRFAQSIHGHEPGPRFGIHVTERRPGEGPHVAADLLLVDLGVNGLPGDALLVVRIGRGGFTIASTAVSGIVHDDRAAGRDGDVLVVRQGVDAVIARALDRGERNRSGVVTLLGDYGSHGWKRGQLRAGRGRQLTDASPLGRRGWLAAAAAAGRAAAAAGRRAAAAAAGGRAAAAAR